MSQTGYMVADTVVTVLSEEHRQSTNAFVSDNAELNNFLQKDALGYQTLNLGITYLLFRKSDQKLLAYITLSMGALKLPEKREEFVFAGKRLADYPKDFPNQLPAILIGKLASDRTEEGKGAATLLLRHTLQIAAAQRKAIGCAFLMAHAYAMPDVVGWYEKKHFKRLIQKIEGRETVPLYFELGNLQ